MGGKPTARGSSARSRRRRGFASRRTTPRIPRPTGSCPIAALDPFRELHLLGGCEERVPGQLVEEELQRVDGRRGEIAVRVRRHPLPAGHVVAHLDPVRLELPEQRLGLLVVELLDDGLDLREQEEPLVVSTSDQRVGRVGHSPSPSQDAAFDPTRASSTRIRHRHPYAHGSCCGLAVGPTVAGGASRPRRTRDPG